MSDSFKDSLVFLVGTTFLVFEVMYLMCDMRILDIPLPNEKLNWKKPVGQVLEKKGRLNGRHLKSLSWYPLTESDGIQIKDFVMSGQHSTARLDIQGSIIELAENTLIQLSFETRDKIPQLKVVMNQGEIRVQSKKQIDLKLKNKHIKIEPNTETLLATRASDDTSSIHVRKGRLEIIDENKPIQSLKAGEEIRINSKREITKIDPNLNARLLFPASGEHLMKPPEEEILFRWEGDDGDTIEVSTNQDFIEPIKVKSSNRSGSTQLNSGKYFWRIYADGKTSPIAEFVVLPWIQYALEFPKNGQKVIVGSTELKWKEIRGASSYTVEISRNEEFSDLVLSEQLKENSFVRDNILPGKYFWRIRALHPELGEWPASPSQIFTIKDRIGAPKPKGAKQLEFESSLKHFFEWISNLLIPPVFADDLPVELQFEWEPIKEAHRYHLEISQSSDFNTLVKAIDTTDSKIILKLPFYEEYFWRISASDSDGTKGQYSETQRIRLEKGTTKKKIVENLPPPQKRDLPPREPNEPKPNLTKVEKNWPKLLLNLGIETSYLYENVRANTLKVDVRGFFGNRFVLGSRFHNNFGNFWNRLWFHPQTFKSKNTTLGDIQPDLKHVAYGMETLIETKHFLFESPLWLGISVEKMPRFHSIGPETIELKGTAIFKFVFGPHFEHDWLGSHLNSRMLIELLPLGQIRGLGVSFRTLKIQTIGSWVSDIEFGFTPRYLWVSSSSQGVFSWIVSLSIAGGKDLS